MGRLSPFVFLFLGPAMARLLKRRAVGFRDSLKTRLTQVSCVGAHGRAPYKPLIKRGLWAHSRAPLQALIKIKWAFACGPSLAHGPQIPLSALTKNFPVR